MRARCHVGMSSTQAAGRAAMQPSPGAARAGVGTAATRGAAKATPAAATTVLPSPAPPEPVLPAPSPFGGFPGTAGLVVGRGGRSRSGSTQALRAAVVEVGAQDAVPPPPEPRYRPVIVRKASVYPKRRRGAGYVPFDSLLRMFEFLEPRACLPPGARVAARVRCAAKTDTAMLRGCVPSARLTDEVLARVGRVNRHWHHTALQVRSSQRVPPQSHVAIALTRPRPYVCPCIRRPHGHGIASTAVALCGSQTAS